MPLQNRVDPFGAIHAVSARGLFTGNRGIIHDPRTKTLLSRRWSIKAWIICVCEFRNRRREVMGPGPNGNGSWTELFFLDEVTALSAGHRPCFYCRREQAKMFVHAAASGLGMAEIRAPELDRTLHSQRGAVKGEMERINPGDLKNVPDGTMVSIGQKAFAVRNGRLLPWSFVGYGPAQPFPAETGELSLITPNVTRMALNAGYNPVWHPTAGA